eukprot:GHVU01016373.1.p1 GENE.GHVU01016373.1~~GHVU01016373.1.p1  ORF type:complete len:362 (-),score=49.71 GHVU01016373.1:234-1319(-)
MRQKIQIIAGGREAPGAGVSRSHYQREVRFGGGDGRNRGEQPRSGSGSSISSISTISEQDRGSYRSQNAANGGRPRTEASTRVVHASNGAGGRNQGSTNTGGVQRVGGGGGSGTDAGSRGPSGTRLANAGTASTTSGGRGGGGVGRTGGGQNWWESIYPHSSPYQFKGVERDALGGGVKHNKGMPPYPLETADGGRWEWPYVFAFLREHGIWAPETLEVPIGVDTYRQLLTVFSALIKMYQTEMKLRLDATERLRLAESENKSALKWLAEREMRIKALEKERESLTVKLKLSEDQTLRLKHQMNRTQDTVRARSRAVGNQMDQYQHHIRRMNQDYDRLHGKLCQSYNDRRAIMTADPLEFS